MNTKRFLALTLGVLLLAVSLIGCSNTPSSSQTNSQTSEKPTIVVASKNFTESYILTELLAQLIENKTDYKVKRVMPLGGTAVVNGAIQKGEIDVYPEYTSGGVITAVLGLKNDPPITDAQKAYNLIKDEFNKKFNLVTLDIFGLNDNYCYAMKRSKAEELGIKTVSDLKSVAGKLTAGFTTEFIPRSDGYSGFKTAYGFEFGKVVNMDAGLMYDAVKNEQVDVINAFATDSRIKGYDLVVLKDDKNFFAPQMAYPLVRGEILNKYPDLKTVLNLLAGKINDSEMVEMNYEVDIKGMEPSAVAKDFLKSKGII